MEWKRDSKYDYSLELGNSIVSLEIDPLTKSYFLYFRSFLLSTDSQDRSLESDPRISLEVNPTIKDCFLYFRESSVEISPGRPLKLEGEASDLQYAVEHGLASDNLPKNSRGRLEAIQFALSKPIPTF